MRLPQDYILHIESAKDGVHVTAEWQGELVRCKDCYHYDKGENESELWQYCRMNRHRTDDNEYCSWAVAGMKGGAE